MRYRLTVKNGVWSIEDHGWNGSDCLKDEYPKLAVDLRFRSQERVKLVCDALNAEWNEFERHPS